MCVSCSAQHTVEDSSLSQVQSAAAAAAIVGRNIREFNGTEESVTRGSKEHV